ncbi:protein jagged-1a-like [Haliotis rubra]|uniref:protein jagged-1a-like n=1 Tax=Haliotis rubra TaxID=36100 RepID=UPI001EE57971|nr:protein jagged-1a-like [Haliotis rubra]
MERSNFGNHLPEQHRLPVAELRQNSSQGVRQVKNEGKLNIKFIRYSSDGTDNNGFCSETWKGPPCNDTCDPMFTLCVKDPRDTKPCSLYYKPTAGMDTGSNNVVFGNSINGTPNPFIIDVDKSMPSSIKIQVTVYDYDQNNADDYMDTLAAFINISASPNKIMSPYKPCSLLSRTNLGIGVRAYCDPDWYGSDCLTYCKAQTTDYYSCQASSGAKICFQGWKGDYCNQDVDECTEMVDVCQHDGSCTNTPGGFQCQCVEGITGKNCELVTNHCALNKCLNGGICNGNETDFKCDCDFPWTGEKCDLNVDITNITVLGVINHNNKGSLITGLRKVINDLGGIQGQVNVVISTHIYSESINITTQVQFYVTLENDAFLTSDFVREIFSSHSDADINQYLPFPLYPARDTDDEEIGITTQENITEGSWFKSNWYKVVGALSAGLVLVALCVLFLMWRRKS